ncbi:MAG: hypothetical protein JWN49_612 [Parcubacteria group bacterium]|nr:hypothetical protein [Parcubacteria group bacterium]
MCTKFILGISLVLTSSQVIAQQQGIPIIRPDIHTVGGMRADAFLDSLLPPDLKEKEVRRAMGIFMKGRHPTAQEREVVRQMAAYCRQARTPNYSPCVAARRILAKG